MLLLMVMLALLLLELLLVIKLLMVLLLLIVLVVFSEISNAEAQFNLSFSEKKEHGMKI